VTPVITRFDVFAVDLPFRKPFKHAAAERACSDSVFVRAETDSGVTGWGECLPRAYVSGETRAGAFALLAEHLLPELLGCRFTSVADLVAYLTKCDGKAPPEWVSSDVPQTAAWSAVDLVLLDVWSRALREPLCISGEDVLTIPPGTRYSTVVSADAGLTYLVSLLKMRAYGFRYAKLKVGSDDATTAVRLARQILGRGSHLRVDANMAWEVSVALRYIAELGKYGVHSFEQPLTGDDIDGLARVTKESGAEIVVDEGFTDSDSLRVRIERQACTGVNVRISKCGGLIGAFERARQAREAGLTIQVGCQVGESSLLSAAHVRLVAALSQHDQELRHLEGCFGTHLLREDPAVPTIRFGYGGRPPSVPDGFGLGVAIDEAVLDRWTVARARVV
jgi:muconate cycloisomerase